MSHPEQSFVLPGALVRACCTLAGLGLACLAAGFVFAPRTAWGSLLLASYLLVDLGLAGLLFVALQYVTGAGWSVGLRRVPEAMTAALVPGLAGLALVFLGQPGIYPWTEHASTPSAHQAPFREFWLSWPFFLVRAGVYAGCWLLFAWAIVRTSRRQDEDGDLVHTRRNVRLSAAFLVVFALSYWLASSDWIMSLEAEWYSTIFGLYNFAGLFLSGLAALTLLVLWLRRLGPLREVVSEEHLHDLGKLLFGFSTFWMYVWFCQYMLIWYVNNPEETVYYTGRLQGAWASLFLVNPLLNWVVPFFALLSRSAKRDPVVLTRICLVLLLGRWLDLFLMILPPLGELTPLGVVAAGGAAVGALALFCGFFIFALNRAKLIPVKDPFLVESLT